MQKYRTLALFMEELRKSDPGTAITEDFIEENIKNGNIPRIIYKNNIIIIDYETTLKCIKDMLRVEIIKKPIYKESTIMFDIKLPPNVSKRGVRSYRIKVCCGYNREKKQNVYTKTIRIPPSLGTRKEITDYIWKEYNLFKQKIKGNPENR